jgi:hypothetical protein
LEVDVFVVEEIAQASARVGDLARFVFKILDVELFARADLVLELLDVALLLLV